MWFHRRAAAISQGFFLFLDIALPPREDYVQKGRTGLMVRASDRDRETRVRSSAGSVCCFLEQETFTPQKVLVIPRNRWLRLNMTEKLFTGTLNHNQYKKFAGSVLSPFLKRGQTWAVFHSVGTVPLSSEVWKIRATTGEISWLSCFKTMGLMASGPAALETLRSERSLVTPAVEITISFIIGNLHCRHSGKRLTREDAPRYILAFLHFRQHCS